MKEKAVKEPPTRTLPRWFSHPWEFTGPHEGRGLNQRPLPRVEVEDSNTVRICRGSVLLQRVTVPECGLLSLDEIHVPLSEDEKLFVIGQTFAAIVRHRNARPGPIKRALIRLRNRLLDSHRERAAEHP